MADLAIELDNAIGVFMPGSEVTGTVVLVVREATKAKCVLITVNGRAHTDWTESEPRTRLVTRTGADGQTHTEKETYYESVPYSASVVYADGRAVVWSPPAGAPTGHIQPGNYRFPFRFLLPANCPSSFEGLHGYIRYYCKAIIDRPWYKINTTSKKMLTVCAISDLNVIPTASLPAQASQSKETGFLFFKNGKITVTASIPKSGFVPGEEISLHAEIDNASSKKVKDVSVTIVQCSHYAAYREHQTVLPEARLPGCPSKKISRREFLGTEEKVEILRGQNEKFVRLIQIPAIPSTFNNCPIISVEYFMKIKVTTSGFISTTIAAQLPIIIGSIPLRSATVGQSGEAPEAPPMYPQIDPMDALPSYEDCVFGAGKVKEEDGNVDFTPRYPFYPNITPCATPSAPPVEKM